MQCRKCQLEKRISLSKNVIQYSELYVVHEYTCVNPQCEDYGKIETISMKQDVEFVKDVENVANIENAVNQ